MAAAAVPAISANAGFWVRVGAYLIDSVILAIPGAIIQFGLFQNSSAGQGIVLLLEIAYFVYFWSAAGAGQTPGMRVLGLKVVKTDGSLLTWAGALLRLVALFISFIVLCIGVIWVAFDPNKQGWHDKIAGTYVVKAA
jgi:uncharacterized RDD family membrane protein YckC